MSEVVGLPTKFDLVGKSGNSDLSLGRSKPDKLVGLSRRELVVGAAICELALSAVITDFVVKVAGAINAGFVVRAVETTKFDFVGRAVGGAKLMFTVGEPTSIILRTLKPLVLTLKPDPGLKTVESKIVPVGVRPRFEASGGGIMKPGVVERVPGSTKFKMGAFRFVVVVELGTSWVAETLCIPAKPVFVVAAGITKF